MEARKLKVYITLLFSVFFIKQSLAFPLERTSITTPEIVARTIAGIAGCLDWCLSGICVWLECVGPVCAVHTSPEYTHNNPDLVVTVFDEVGEDPWTEMNATVGTVQKTIAETVLSMLTPIPIIGGGHRTEDDINRDTSLRYKEASAYGHPASGISDYAGGIGLCPSEATPLQPYFQSGLDALEWRISFREMGYSASWIPGRRVVGEGMLQQWGPVFPRGGAINQKDDPKAGAVIAQRVGNIITGERGLHVVTQFDGNDYDRTVLPGELMENDKETGTWQMLAPKKDTTCSVFGEDDTLDIRGWSTNRTTDDNSYVYTLWRKYKCCEKKGVLISVIPLPVCPTIGA